MSAETIYVQLTWEDPETNELQQPLLAPPIAIGRETGQIPEKLGTDDVACLRLPHKQVSRYHALITMSNNQMYITDYSANGTFVNGRRLKKGSQPFSSKDTLRIGPYKITAALMGEHDLDATELNRETVFPQQSSPTNFSQKKLMVGLIGALLLLLMGLSTWLIVSNLLRNSRPHLNPDSTSQSRFVQDNY